MNFKDESCFSLQLRAVLTNINYVSSHNIIKKNIMRLLEFWGIQIVKRKILIFNVSKVVTFINTMNNGQGQHYSDVKRLCFSWVLKLIVMIRPLLERTQ